MSPKRPLALVIALAALVAGAAAQAKPLVAVLTAECPLYDSASETGKKTATLDAGTPLVIKGSKDAKAVVDGVPTLWYQVQTSEAATGWVPGSRLAFSPTALKRSDFPSSEQYLTYIMLAARQGEKVIAVRSYEKVAKGDVGYFVQVIDGEPPVCVVWERNLDATPSTDYLPGDFPAALQPFTYFVYPGDVEIVGDKAATPLKTLAQRLPKAYPEADGYYAEGPDDEFPWYLPPETTYADSYGDEGYDEYGDEYYGEEEGYYDEEYVEGEETYGQIKVGTVVILGKHEDINGGANWAAEMDKFVGKQATVTSLLGADSQGFLCVTVKGNGFSWRVRNLAVKGRGEAGSYGFQVGDSVILGAHRYIADDNNWAYDMGEYVGQVATITSFEGTDGSDSFIVHVDVDNGDWVWRVENMTPAD